MKKLILLILLILILSTYSYAFSEGLDLSGEAAILIDVDTMEVLYEKNSHTKLYPASTTKIMTGILAIEMGKMDDIVTIDQEIVSLTGGSHIALEPGEELTLEQLLNALLVESANDAALAIAKHISGSIEGFVSLMNEKAKSLGALNTNFVNPSGMPHDEHVTTAYDLALMGKYAMENETFRDIVKNYTYIIPVTNKKTEQRYLKSANRLLYSNEKVNVKGEPSPIKYEGVNGVKTGYTVAAQQCLVTSFERDGDKLIAVVLKANGKNIYSDIHQLLDYGRHNFDKLQIGFANRYIDNFKVQNGTLPFVAGVTKSDSFYIVKREEAGSITENLMMEKELAAPIKKNDTIGTIQYLIDGKVIGESDIISTIDVDLQPVPSILDRLKAKWYLLVFILLFLNRIATLNRRRKKLRRRRASLYRI